jgi:hypothetical protein
VISNPAKTLVCSNTSIQVTLANGDVMTIPIEGNINVDLSQGISLYNIENK